MKEYENQKRLKVVGSMFFSLLLTLIISSFCVNLSSVADSLCVSIYLGDNAMAAYSLAKPIFKFFAIFSGVIVSGLQIVLASELGKGNQKRANRLFTFYFVVCFILGVILLILGLTIPSQIAYIFGARDPSLNKQTADFLQGVLIGAPFLLLYSALLPLYSFDGAKRLIKVCALVNVCVDILFNVLNGQFFGLGMFGMGLSTSIGYVVAVLPMIGYLLIKKQGLKFDFSCFTFKGTGSVVSFGLPHAIRRLSSSFSDVIVNFVMMSVGGAVCLTASGIEGSVFGVVNVIVSSIPSVFVSLYSMFRLDHDKESVHHMFKIIIYYVIIFMGAALAIIIPIAPYIVKLFNVQGAEAFNQSVLALRIGLTAIPIALVPLVFMSYLQVNKRFLASNIYTVVFFFVMPVAMNCLFGFTLGTIGIWIALPAASFMNIVVIYVAECIIHKKFTNPFKAIFPYEKDIGAEGLVNYNFNITSVDELSNRLPDIRSELEKQIPNRKTLDDTIIVLQQLVVHDKYVYSLIDKYPTDCLIQINGEHVTLRIRDSNPKLTPTKRSEIFKQKLEAAKDNNEIIILKDKLKNIEVIDFLNVHNIVFTIS